MSGGLRQLAVHGRRYRDPLAAIDWERAEPEKPWLPPSMLSLAGLPIQRSMNAEQIRRLSQVEFARLAAAGVDPPDEEVDRLAGLYPGLRRTIDRFHAIDVGDEVTAAVFRASEAADRHGPLGGDAP